jgi:dipeptidyl aminopeptidase/acylaminoacyl peptidase
MPYIRPLNSTDSIYRQEVTQFKSGISNVKVAKLPDGNIALACSALTTPKGELATPETDPKPQSTAKLYTSLFVRHWDAWLTENRNSIWYTALKEDKGKYSIADSGLVNALGGTNLESPVPNFGGSGDFDISPSGLVFVAKDPTLNEAIYTKTDLYYIALKTFTELKPAPPQIVETPGLEGYSNSPTFSRCGTKVAFTRMRSKQYESDKTRLMVIPDIGQLTNVQEFYKTGDSEGGWDARPESIVWSADDKSLFVTAEKEARTRVWQLPAAPDAAKNLPTAVITPDGSVNDVRLLPSDKLFVTTASLIDSSCFSVVSPSTGVTDVVSSSSKNGKTFGLSRTSCDEIWFDGAGDYKVHALVMRPSKFDDSKKYPLAFLIHGGPQGAWLDGWSTRWNPAVFAEQGYVVVAPNPTGSSGYGMALQDGIIGSWGGRPYEDLVKCFEHIEAHMPYVDTDRAVALGASYGGFMINWIQGQPLGRKFKALVCHDGVFSTMNQWSTEELFFPIHDFKGTLYDNPQGYEKWNPASFLNAWATPHMVSSDINDRATWSDKGQVWLTQPSCDHADNTQRARLPAAHHRGPCTLQRSASEGDPKQTVGVPRREPRTSFHLEFIQNRVKDIANDAACCNSGS